VARNRKRAKERRNRRPQSAVARPGGTTTRVDREDPRRVEREDPRRVEREDPRVDREDDSATPVFDREGDGANPMRHAAPDVELAEAQMALGRPDLADADPELAESEPVFADAAEPEALDEEEFETLEDEVDEEALERPSDGARSDRGGELVASGGAVAERHGGAVAEHRRPWFGARLVNFLRGSWRELQRVQWPDRRQVIQATAVVIGFVIVAGLFLGVADFFATKIMNFILK